MSFLLHFAFSLTRTTSRSFQSVTARTAKKFLRFEHPTAKKLLRFYHATAKKLLRFYHATAKKLLCFYHATAKKFMRFPGLKLKRPAISHKKLLLADAKRSSCACIIFGLYCTYIRTYLHIILLI